MELINRFFRIANAIYEDQLDLAANKLDSKALREIKEDIAAYVSSLNAVKQEITKRFGQFELNRLMALVGKSREDFQAIVLQKQNEYLVEQKCYEETTEYHAKQENKQDYLNALRDYELFNMYFFACFNYETKIVK